MPALGGGPAGCGGDFGGIGPSGRDLAGKLPVPGGGGGAGCLRSGGVGDGGMPEVPLEPQGPVGGGFGGSCGPSLRRAVQVGKARISPMILRALTK